MGNKQKENRPSFVSLKETENIGLLYGATK